jgi:hypothetical protein
MVRSFGCPGSFVPACQQPSSADSQAAWVNTLSDQQFRLSPICIPIDAVPIPNHTTTILQPLPLPFDTIWGLPHGHNGPLLLQDLQPETLHIPDAFDT